jgi:DNA-binding response OmpR family regulator
MSTRIIRLLHVEDDAMLQRLVAHHLEQIKELRFAITCAESEEEAVAAALRSPPDFVIMDYHLSQGNGLNCLLTLRRKDPVVPIIAVSGSATPAIAAQLLQSGADDFISKGELRAGNLAHSIRVALLRADAWRRQLPNLAAPLNSAARFKDEVQHLCQMFLTRLDGAFWRRLAECDTATREAHLTGAQVIQAFDEISTQIAMAQQADAGVVTLRLRPLLLELQARRAEAEC